MSLHQLNTTLTQHIFHQQSERFQGKLSHLITHISLAAKSIASHVRRAGIIEIWGQTGEINVQGEEVQRLDEIAHNTFVDVLKRSQCVCALASEEASEWIPVDLETPGNFSVVFDPLDGSSNIEVSTSIGTIFGIYAHPQAPQQMSDILRPGREMIAAGYIIYGSSTVLVYADQERVDCFTLDPMVGEFFLSRANLKTTRDLHMISINDCNRPYWPEWVARYLSSVCAMNQDQRLVTSRHIGSLVADFHRNLIKGGVYLYPVDRYNRVGKLRLLYECNPLAFIAKTAGGRDSWGAGSVLDIQPKDLHQRSGFYVGVSSSIEAIESVFDEDSTI